MRTAETVVDDLVVIEDAHRVGLLFTVQIDAQHAVVVGEKAGVCCRHKVGCVESRDAIPRWAAMLDLFNGHQRPGQVKTVAGPRMQQLRTFPEPQGDEQQWVDDPAGAVVCAPSFLQEISHG